MLDFKQYLTEKLIILNNGARYGQVVFLAGGAGSGKGFAGSNFMEIDKFKVRDVDAWKTSFQKIAAIKNKYPEIQNLDLKNPKHVSNLHMFVDKLKIKDKTMNNMLKDMKNPKTLPNIVFDVTMKNTKYLNSIIPVLKDQGYDTKNIHLLWVLADYKVAVQNNANRERVVADDILLQTHAGAAKTMWDIVGKSHIPKDLDGGIYVILNNKKNTVFFKNSDGTDYRGATDNKDDEKRKATGTGKLAGKQVGRKRTNAKDFKHPIIKDFKYLIYKKPGKSPETSAKIKLQLYTWVVNNIPVTSITSNIWDD